MKKLKELNKKSIIIILLLFVLLISLIYLILGRTQIVENIKEIFQKEEVKQDIEYEIYSNENNMLRYIVTITDTENGIQEVEYPNGDKLECNGKTEVGIDYVIKENGTYTFKAITTTGEEITKDIIIDDDYRENRLISIEKLLDITQEKICRVDYNLGKLAFNCYYTIGEDSQEWKSANNGIIIDVDAYDELRNGKIKDGTIALKLKKEDKFGDKIEIQYKFDVPSDLYNTTEQTIEGESIIACVRDNEIKSGNYTIKVNGESYPAEIYNYEEDVNYMINKSFGTTEQDGKMVIMKYNKNFSIDGNHLITAKERKKGMFICVKGELTNNGEISMTEKGANATGQNVYLLKNEDNTYECVPAVGGQGGAKTLASATTVGLTEKQTVEVTTNANNGINGTGRQTGGGMSGSAQVRITMPNLKEVSAAVNGGSGGNGTSYSGGDSGTEGDAEYTTTLRACLYTRLCI